MFFEAVCTDFGKGQLHLSARRGILSLVPKKGRDGLEIKNWHPLTMLTLDYKIISKALDNRLKTVLPKLIEPYLTGFMENRNILINIVKLMQIMTDAQTAQVNALIMAIDFEKYFDMIEHKAIEGALRYFRFGPNFIKWVLILFTNFEVYTQNNGYISEWLTPTRGLHQECCISPDLYYLTGQMFADLFVQNSRVSGVQFREIVNLLSQFADDTNLSLHANKDNIDNVSQTLVKAERNLGLRVNYEKTTIYRIGSMVQSNVRYYTQKTFVWDDPPITTLGVIVSADFMEMGSLNVKPVIEKVDAVLSQWQNCKLTLMGRVLVVNTLVELLFVYRFSVTPYIDPTLYKRIEDKISDFIWQGKKPKIAFKLLTHPKEQGGLWLIDIRAKHTTLLSQWVFLKNSDEYLKVSAQQSLSPMLGDNIWLINCKAKDIVHMYPVSFWRYILLAWCKCTEIFLMTYHQVLGQFIWLNSHIRIGNKPILYDKLYHKGCKYISDLLNEKQNNFKSYNDLPMEY